MRCNLQYGQKIHARSDNYGSGRGRTENEQIDSNWDEKLALYDFASIQWCCTGCFTSSHWWWYVCFYSISWCQPSCSRYWVRVCCRANCTRPHKALGMCHKHYKSIAVKVRVLFFKIQICSKSLRSLILKGLWKTVRCVVTRWNPSHFHLKWQSTGRNNHLSEVK